MNAVNGFDFDHVAETRWSLVRRMHAARPGDADDALAELAVHYWYPVYAYVRRCGHAPEIAQDIVRSFFQHVGDGVRKRDELPRGRFRDWLLGQLNGFLAADWRAPVAGDPLTSAAPDLDDLERRSLSEHPAGSSPEQAYRRGFALEVLARGFGRLRMEARETGHLDMYEALEQFLTRDPLPGEYDELAGRLGSRPLALVIALKRLRQRFRELVEEELAATVGSAEDIAEEQRVLLAALDGRG